MFPYVIAQLRQYLEVHQVIAALATQDHAAVFGDHPELVEQSGKEWIFHRLRPGQLRIVPALKGPQFVQCQGAMGHMKEFRDRAGIFAIAVGNQ